MKKNNKKYMLVILLFLVVGISIGYAALTTTLNINGNTKIEKASWDIHFDNLVKSTGSEDATVEASIDDTKTLIEYTVTLTEPGDYYEFTVDMVNNGTIDAMVSEVLKEGLSSDQEKYIEYSATYSDGIALEEKDYLKSGEKENIKVRVKYREDISSEDLPTEETSLNLSFSVTYVQADESAKEKNKLVCRRATTLNTNECNQTDPDLYCSSSGYTLDGKLGTTTITYGSLGTTGTLTSGDAFDCDVNNDGNFDSDTERFYYVSDLDTDNNYAVLIYNSNVSNGVPSNISPFVYNTDKSGYLGPQTAILQQITTSQWKGVSLSNTIRDISDEKGTVRVSGFNYDGYATRLLTVQEVENACNVTVGVSTTGMLDSCNYLFENTMYSSADIPIVGFWLENVYSIDSSKAWYVACRVRDAYYGSVNSNSTLGVRPAIEVLKSNISY